MAWAVAERATCLGTHTGNRAHAAPLCLVQLGIRLALHSILDLTTLHCKHLTLHYLPLPPFQPSTPSTARTFHAAQPHAAYGSAPPALPLPCAAPPLAFSRPLPAAPQKHCALCVCARCGCIIYVCILCVCTCGWVFVRVSTCVCAHGGSQQRWLGLRVHPAHTKEAHQEAVKPEHSAKAQAAQGALRNACVPGWSREPCDAPIWERGRGARAPPPPSHPTPPHPTRSKPQKRPPRTKSTGTECTRTCAQRACRPALPLQLPPQVCHLSHSCGTWCMVDIGRA